MIKFTLKLPRNMTKGEPFFKEKFQVSGIIIVFWGKDMDYVMYSPRSLALHCRPCVLNYLAGR